jgi:DNA-binding CsgD family transcriptional regulator
MDFSALSAREREVLDLALAGLSARAVAERLSLTEATVRSHLSRIYAKLDVGGRVELLAQMYRNDVGALMNRNDVTGDTPSAPARSPGMSRQSRLTALGLALGMLFAWAELAVFGILGPAAGIALATLGLVVSWHVAKPIQVGILGGAGASLIAVALFPAATCPGGAFSSACTYPDVTVLLALGASLAVTGALIAVSPL